jgi:hypothetical protein
VNEALGFECGVERQRAGELAIVRAREKAEKTLGANGADGISDIEGKVAEGSDEQVGQRASFKFYILVFSTMLCSSSA